MWSAKFSRQRRWGGAATLALALLGAALPAKAQAPYPQSAHIAGVAFDWNTYRRHARGSDNWVTTWAADGKVYTSWGDGGGFGPPDAVRNHYVSIGFAEITGSTARTVAGTNLIGGLNPTIALCMPYFTGDILFKVKSPTGTPYPCWRKTIRAKSRSLLALDDHIYYHITPGSAAASYREARIYRNKLRTNTWERADWAFEPEGPYPIIAPAFLQAGRNYVHEPEWVYAYAIRFAPTDPDHQSIQKGPNGGEITLMRAARGGDLLKRASWAFFTGLDGAGRPTWSVQQSLAKGVFFDKNGVGWNLSAIYVPGLDRYLITTANTKTRSGKFGIFESPNPWGPWRTVAYTTLSNASLGVPAQASGFRFLANSFSTDGRKFTLVFAGPEVLDSMNLVDVTLKPVTDRAP